MNKSKILKDLTLLAKYISLKKASMMVSRNLSMFDMDMVDDHLKDHVGTLNEEVLNVKKELDVVVNLHKQMFLTEAPLLYENGEPTESFRDLYLSVIFMSGGDITGCLTFLNDLISVANPAITINEQINSAIDYTRWMVSSGLLTPQAVVLADDGTEMGREDLDELDGAVEVTRVKLTLTPNALDVIRDVVDEITEKRSHFEDMSLMTMESPSRMLN